MSTSGGPAWWASKNRLQPFIRQNGESVETDTLNSLVSGAIWRAEQLEARGIASASQAWAEVSSLEGELSKLLPASESEGRIARRGAVRAALKARDYARAYTLTEDYSSEECAPRSLKAELNRIVQEDARTLSRRFRYAAKHHSMGEARDLARRFRKAGAFGLAA